MSLKISPKTPFAEITAGGFPVLLTITNGSDRDVVSIRWGCKYGLAGNEMVSTGRVRPHSTTIEWAFSQYYRPGEQPDCIMLYANILKPEHNLQKRKLRGCRRNSTSPHLVPYQRTLPSAVARGEGRREARARSAARRCIAPDQRCVWGILTARVAFAPRAGSKGAWTASGQSGRPREAPGNARLAGGRSPRPALTRRRARMHAGKRPIGAELSPRRRIADLAGPGRQHLGRLDELAPQPGSPELGGRRVCPKGDAQQGLGARG